MSKSRKHLTNASTEAISSLGANQHIVQAVKSRGDNLFDVRFSNGRETLVLLPAKFNKTIWIRAGTYLIVQQDGEESNRISGSVDAVLDKEDIRTLRKNKLWPQEFEDQQQIESKPDSMIVRAAPHNIEADDTDDSDLSPLQPNTNRPVFEYQLQTDSDEDED